MYSEGEFWRAEYPKVAAEISFISTKAPTGAPHLVDCELPVLWNFWWTWWSACS